MTSGFGLQGREESEKEKDEEWGVIVKGKTGKREDHQNTEDLGT